MALRVRAAKSETQTGQAFRHAAPELVDKRDRDIALEHRARVLRHGEQLARAPLYVFGRGAFRAAGGTGGAARSRWRGGTPDAAACSRREPLVLEGREGNPL